MVNLSSSGEAARVLVIGASGMLGRALMRDLAAFPAKYEPLGTGNSRLEDGLVKLDLLDSAAVDALLERFRPTVVINCAAVRDPERAAADPERTKRINVHATRVIAEACARVSACLVHLSTDYVFDGGIHSKALPPYDVDSPTHPLNLYAQTKLESEGMALGVKGARTAVVRVPVLYARDCRTLDESSSLTEAKKLLSSEQVVADDWGQRYPTLVDDVAVVIRKLVDLKLRAPPSDAERSSGSAGPSPHDDGASGILHCSSPHRTTKFQLTQLMARILGVDGSHVRSEPREPTGELRPRNTQLDCRRTWEALGEAHQFHSLEEGIALALERFKPEFAAAARAPT
jgi:S-adenosylmethionine synthetase